MFVKKDIDMYDLDDLLWSGARDRWVDATDDQKESVWERLNDWLSGDIPSETEVNDIVWFECDDIFFPEPKEEEESRKRRIERKRVMLKRRMLRK